MLKGFEGSILFVGAGKMGGAMLAGLLEEGLDPDQIRVQDPGPPPQVADLLAKYEIEAVASVTNELNPAIVILCVKPQIMDQVLPTVTPVMSEQTLVLSIAAGKTIAGIEAHIGSGKPVVRAMPNTPAEIGRSMTVLCANGNVTEDQKEMVADLLASIGEVAWCDSEDDMDAVTALSGSGPAYIFHMAESMAQAGIDAGLSEELAWRLAKSTISGAGELMRTSDLSPSTLRENVTSPAGTTEAALNVLMAEDGLKPLVSKAIAAAKARSKELSQ